MTEISATVTPQAAAAAGKGGTGVNGGAAPFGALGFLSLILSGNGQGNGDGGIGLLPGQAVADVRAQALQNIPGLQQALRNNGGNATAALQSLQTNSRIDLSTGGLAGGMMAQLIANLSDGQAAPLTVGNSAVSHALTGEEILQFDPTQLTIEQLISGELESVTLPNGKEITDEQALLVLLLKGRISAIPPQGANKGPALQAAPTGTTGAADNSLQDKPTRPEDTLAALLAAAGQQPQQTPQNISGQAPQQPGQPAAADAPQNAGPGPAQAAAPQPSAPSGDLPAQGQAATQATAQGALQPQTAGQNTPPAAGQPQQGPMQQGQAKQGQAQQPAPNTPAPAPGTGAPADEPPRAEYEWRAGQNAGQSNAKNTAASAPGSQGRDTAIQSLISALNQAPQRNTAGQGPQHALNVLQTTPQGLVVAADGFGDGGGFDTGANGHGPFSDADGLIEEMLSQHHSQTGRSGEARPSQSFTSLLTTARSATAGHPATQSVAVQMSRMSAAGTDRITLRLDPPELGRVEVRMEFGDDGKVRAHLIADRPDTLDTLQRDARMLERALQEAGLETDEGSLTFDLRQGDDNNGQDPQDGRSRNAYSGMDGAENDEGGEITAHIDVMPDGMAGHMKVDLLV